MARNGAVEGEAVLIGGERLGRRVGSGQGRVLEGEGSAADSLSDRDAIADRRGNDIAKLLPWQVERDVIDQQLNKPVST
ncbi:MAG: hypothetical protein O3A63_10885 [Proteobacteria bacterium]|nr:hypothetical protein [Pseudomonadota bacterium]